MTVGPAGFQLSSTSLFTSADINVPGSIGTVSTTVQPLGNFSGSVTFTVDSNTVPAGVTVTPSTQQVAATGQARLQVSAVSPATAGQSQITVNAVSGSQTVPVTIFLTLRGQLTLAVSDSRNGGPAGTETVPLVLAPGSKSDPTVSDAGLVVFDQASGAARLIPLPAGVARVHNTGNLFIKAATNKAFMMGETGAAGAADVPVWFDLGTGSSGTLAVPSPATQIQNVFDSPATGLAVATANPEARGYVVWR